MNLAPEAQQQDPASTWPQDPSGDAWLVYDGDCPFCSRYVQYLRLRQAAGPVRLVNAREGGPLVDELQRAGLDLDEGMVLKLGGRYYHGADCIHALSLLSSGSGLFNRINAKVFRSPQLSRVLYPVLRTGRNTVLSLLGRTKIASPGCKHAKLPPS
jgi:predicted DCC family thiol-disulfide oxidoreductase YuxK